MRVPVIDEYYEVPDEDLPDFVGDLMAVLYPKWKDCATGDITLSERYIIEFMTRLYRTWEDQDAGDDEINSLIEEAKTFSNRFKSRLAK